MFSISSLASPELVSDPIPLETRLRPLVMDIEEINDIPDTSQPTCTFSIVNEYFFFEIERFRTFINKLEEIGYDIRYVNLHDSRPAWKSYLSQLQDGELAIYLYSFFHWGAEVYYKFDGDNINYLLPLKKASIPDLGFEEVLTYLETKFPRCHELRGRAH